MTHSRIPVAKPSPRCGAGLNAIALLALGAFALTGLAGCSEQINKHGYQFRESDIQQIQPGMSQEQVRTTLGTPATTAVVAGADAFYYISSTTGQTAFFKPVEKDRQILAVYFNQGGTVEQIANYGLKDGKIFDYVTRKTPAPGGKDEGILQSLFRNLGRRQIFGE